jgi:hypothetical protein
LEEGAKNDDKEYAGKNQKDLYPFVMGLRNFYGPLEKINPEGSDKLIILFNGVHRNQALHANPTSQKLLLFNTF